MPGVPNCLDTIDQIRRTQGMLMQNLGFGAEETRSSTVHSLPGARLRFYGGNAASRCSALVVPAPIKRPYIWDLVPERSVVRRLLEAGFAVYLVEWACTSEQGQLGLEDYAGRLLDECVDAVRKNSAGPVCLVGHSLGGTFAALYGAWRPQKIDGLVVVEAPLRFGAAAGALKPLVDLQLDRAIGSEYVPGWLLGSSAAFAAPDAFIADRHRDFLLSLRSPLDLQIHLRVVRWTLDEFPMSRKLVGDLVEQLYRKDNFAQGRLTFGGITLGPRKIRAPIFAVFDPASRLIPPASMLDFLAAVKVENKQAAPYEGDIGVALQHVGPLVGGSAHQKIWPKIIDWLSTLPAK